MAGFQKPRLLSVEGGLALLVAIFAAASDMNWWLRTLFVVAGFGLIGHLVGRIPRHPIVRAALGIIGASLLLSVTWQPIWDDFYKKHPEFAGIWFGWADKRISEFTEFIVETPVWVALVILGASLLGWGWHPVLIFRHSVAFRWRTALGEETWITGDKALELVSQSQWAKSRKRRNEKPKSQIMSFNFLMSNPEAEEIQRMFYRWCLLALEGFSTHEPNAVRQSPNGAEYAETFLKRWLDSRYESDVIAEFGQPM